MRRHTIYLKKLDIWLLNHQPLGYQAMTPCSHIPEAAFCTQHRAMKLKSNSLSISETWVISITYKLEPHMEFEGASNFRNDGWPFYF